MPLFRQDSFVGGLNAQLDATKIHGTTLVAGTAKSYSESYPLLVNGRVRRNVVAPTNRHLRLSGPPGLNYQGLYIAGSYLLLFVDGLAYYGDITADPIIFIPVSGWTLMDSGVSRIYAELAPATSNLFNRAGTPDSVTRTFNNTIAVFNQALYCFDGVNIPQAILPGNTAVPLGNYNTWTKDAPLYVPIGVLPAFASNKLFLISPDNKRILSSVSGRPSDFVINIDPAGDKGGDADSYSQTVSFNPITAVRSVSTGEVLVGTLYGTFVLSLDYNNTTFGEPFEQPIFLFPAGPVNELSIIDILSDTAMITQSGIHAFNPTAQAKKESNNFPLGAKIRGLLTNPNTNKAIIQENTCATVYDDYGMFAVNTIFGYGVLIYDTISSNWQALDMSFGRVKQFATTKISGIERLFFITADNQIYEGFAGVSKNVTRILLGEWTPVEAGSNILAYIVNLIFANVRESGQVKLTIYADHKEVDSVILNITAQAPAISLPLAIPFPDANSVATSGYHFKHDRAWRISAMVEWNFSGELSDFSIDGKIEAADNVSLVVPDVVASESFAFIADSGYSDELNPGGIFSVSGFVIIAVVKGTRYAYIANGNGNLVNGNATIMAGIFTAATDTVAIKGDPGDSYDFSLRTAENYSAVIDAIDKEKIKGLIHGGDFAYSDGRQLDVTIARLPIHHSFFGVAGNHDVVTAHGKAFYNLMKQPRSGLVSFDYVDFFMFNGEPFEPDGNDAISLQTGIVKNWLAASVKPYKILVIHRPLYTNDVDHYPGEIAFRYLMKLPGLSAILSGHGHVMERFDTNGFPTFVCGAGGQPLRAFQPNTSSAFRDNTHFGYLSIKADALTCRLSFKDTNNNVLDTYALYA